MCKFPLFVSFVVGQVIRISFFMFNSWRNRKPNRIKFNSRCALFFLKKSFCSFKFFAIFSYSVSVLFLYFYFFFTMNPTITEEASQKALHLIFHVVNNSDQLRFRFISILDFNLIVLPLSFLATSTQNVIPFLNSPGFVSHLCEEI